MKNIENNACRAWKDKINCWQTRYDKKMFAETSDKLLINTGVLVPKLKKTKSNKFLLQISLTQNLQIEQAQKYIQLGISKWSFYNIKTKN